MQNDIDLTCRTCGRDFIIPSHLRLFPCPGCQTPHARPKATGESLADLRRAHTQRAACQFTDAERNYQLVLNRHPDEAEALWGLALCRYGVEYVADDRTREQRPVLHFLQRTPFTEDNDYRLACARADGDVRPQYLSDGAYINQIQQDVLAAESRQESWDIFLCYKQSVPGSSDPNAHTREFDHARDLYDALRDAGYRVFFAHKVLTNIAGAHYEAKIFSALHSARVMLVVCSNPAYLNTPWVRSEWSRYLKRVDKQEDSLLIPLLYDGCDAYDMPDPFIARSLQGLDMRPVTALDDLRRRLNGRMRRPDASQAAPAPIQSPETKRALLRLHMALEDSAWQKAETLAADLIDKIPDCGEAHLGLLLARRQLPDASALAACDTPFEKEKPWLRAMQFADPELKKQLEECLETHRLTMEMARKQQAEQAERLRREQEEAERRRLQQEEAEQLRLEQEEAERIRRRHEEAERLLREHLEAERRRLQQEEAEQLRREQEEAERIRLRHEEAERLLREHLEAERLMRRDAINELVGTLEAVIKLRQQEANAQLCQQRDRDVAYLYQLLEKGAWTQAESTAKALCAAWPTHVPARLGMVLAACHLHTEDELARCTEPFGNSPQWESLMEYATPEERTRLNCYAKAALEHQMYLKAEQADQQRREKRAELFLRQYEAEKRHKHTTRKADPRPKAEEASRKQAEEKKSGVVTFTRKKELLFGKTPIHIYLDNRNTPVCSLRAGDPTFSIRCSTPTTIRARTADGVDCFTWTAQPGIITQFEVTWPLLGKPNFTVVSSTPRK